jgi:hypothetical protein
LLKSSFRTWYHSVNLINGIIPPSSGNLKHNKLPHGNPINIKIELPQEVVKKPEPVIIETATKTIKANVENIGEEPKMYTRKEAAQALRITLPTLRQYEIQGRLIPKRAGKRVLYPKPVIEHFIAAL